MFSLILIVKDIGEAVFVQYEITSGIFLVIRHFVSEEAMPD